jgi:hypothetical protein
MAILDWVVEDDLIGNIDPVHYSIRLLVPEGSLVLPEMSADQLGPYDAERLSYRWSPDDPSMDDLQRELAAIAEAGAEAEEPIPTTFYRIRRAVFGDEPQIETGSVEGRPRMTEPWFC